MPVEFFNIDKGYSVFSDSDYETAKHSHYAIEIVCCTEGSFSVTTNVSEYANLESVIIPSNISHSFSCINATCNLLFLDPLSDIGMYFLQQYDLASQKNIIVNPPGLNQFQHFWKNIAIVGGSLAFVAFGAGAYSLDARRSSAQVRSPT